MPRRRLQQRGDFLSALIVVSFGGCGTSAEPIAWRRAVIARASIASKN
jgi:hypothetical protein